jgi:hypothetical protein
MSDLPSNAPQNPPRRRLVRLGLIVVFGVLVLIGGGLGFKYAKLRSSLIRGRREFEKKQYMRAEFWTGRALSVDARNVEALRLMAEIEEGQDRPAALGWRIRVVQCLPGNTGDIVAWAKCAFRFGQREMALYALKSLPANFQENNADYHELMAGFALAVHVPGAAEAHFARAAELDPTNALRRINLAAYRVANSPKPEIREAARQELENALEDPQAAAPACRALLAEAIRNHDAARSRALAEKLRAVPNRAFHDDLACLDAAAADPTFPAALAETERRAGSDVQKVVALGDWLNTHQRADETLRWIGQLPEATRMEVRVKINEAEAYLAMRDWTALDAFLEKSHWADGEYLRKLMIIRCQRELGQPWEKDWGQLVALVEASPPEGFLVAQLIIGWGWRPEAIDLLWKAARQPQTNALALESLWQIYGQSNETRELLRVAKAQGELDPANPTMKNNEAFLSMLLMGGSERAERLAREATQAKPKIPEWAATYAYALHLQGKNAEAKKVMLSQPAEALARPGIALYAAIVLAANGEADQAREALTKLNPRGMLPEEQKLAADLAAQLKVASR